MVELVDNPVKTIRDEEYLLVFIFYKKDPEGHINNHLDSMFK